MTWLIWEPDPTGRYGLRGELATLRHRTATARQSLSASEGAVRLTGHATRLRHRVPYRRDAYALTGAAAGLVRR